MAAPGAAASQSLPPDGLSLAVGRTLGTVVVTVEGEVSAAGGELLDGLLTDLIEGQGDLSLAINLRGAIVKPEANGVFIAAAQRARRHGARFVVTEPPAATHEALRAAGVAGGIEIQPRRLPGD